MDTELIILLVIIIAAVWSRVRENRRMDLFCVLTQVTGSFHSVLAFARERGMDFPAWKRDMHDLQLETTCLELGVKGVTWTLKKRLRPAVTPEIWCLVPATKHLVEKLREAGSTDLTLDLLISIVERCQDMLELLFPDNPERQSRWLLFGTEGINLSDLKALRAKQNARETHDSGYARL